MRKISHRKKEIFRVKIDHFEKNDNKHHYNVRLEINMKREGERESDMLIKFATYVCISFLGM